MQDYTVSKELAKGGMGCTYIAQRNRDNQTLVIKQVVCQFQHVNDALKEAKTLMHLKHEGVVKYEDFFLDEKTSDDGKRLIIVCIAMEYCERGDLAVYLKNLRCSFRLRDDQIRFCFASQ
jgi:serine/threonine protein kinase